MRMIEKPELQISDKVAGIPEALSVYMNNVVYAMKRRDIPIVTLSLGEAYFDIPFWGFEDEDIRKGYHYSESLGLPELRSKIAAYYSEQYQAVVNGEKDLLISAGSKPLIFMALQAVLNPGDEVLLHDPEWLSYAEQIKLAGGVPVYIPYGCKPCDFENYITERTKVLIINNPNNPAGIVYRKEDLAALYRTCRPRGIYILADEAYSDFITDGSFVSMLHVVPDKDGIIVVNSLSKNLGISGWRIGYVISMPTMIHEILKLNQHLVTCASSLLLLYVAKHFEELLQLTLPQAQAITRRRNEMEKYIRSQGLQTLEGSATFYIFVSIGAYPHSAIEFALYLLFRYHISVVPGSAYGKSTSRFIRIGVGTESDATMHEAIGIIKKVIQEQEYDEGFVERSYADFGIEKFQ